MAPDRQRWNDQALDQLNARVNDMHSLLGEFRRETTKALGALTRERKDGKLEPAPGGLGMATWIALFGIVVVPIVLAIIGTK
jgi:hypothetical protein